MTTSKEDKFLSDIAVNLEKLTIAETVNLIEFLENRWGVSAAAAVAVAAGPAVVEEEDSEKEVLLKAMGDKIKTIKAIRELNSELSLMDAKKAVESISDSTPYSLGKFEKLKAEELIKKFTELQASPVLK